MGFTRQQVFRWTLLFLSGVACLVVLLPFLIEILSAIFFAFALFPLTKSLSTKKYFHHRGWVAVTLFCFILAVTLPIVLLAYSFFRLFTDLTSEGFAQSELYADLIRGKDFIVNGVARISDQLDLPGNVDLASFANQMLTGIGGKIMAISGAIVTHLPEYGLSLFIFCCALYLFLADARKIRFLLMHNRLLPSYELDQLIPLLQKSCQTTLLASLIVGCIQASIVTVGALILETKHGFLIFLVTFIFSFIPVIGAAPVAFGLAFLALVKDQGAYAIGYVVIGVLAGTVDNFVRPWLVRGEENIHPVVMLLAIIGAILLFGIPGLFLGPMFISAAVQIYSLYVFGSPDDPKAEAPPVEQLNEL